MAQVTTNTQINTINILDEASSLNDNDYFLIQRGVKSYKILEENVRSIADNSVDFTKLQDLSNSVVIGNMSGSSGNPQEITVYDEDDFASNSDTGLATQQSIKAYVDSATSGGNIVFIPPVTVTSGVRADTGWLTQSANASWSGANALIATASTIDLDSGGNSSGKLTVRASNSAQSVEILYHQGTSGQRSVANIQAIIPVSSAGSFQYNFDETAGNMELRSFKIIGYFA